MSLVEWIESTGIARSVGESLLFTAWLSATHILGFTLIMSGALLVNLRLLGALLPERALSEVSRPVGRAIGLGLAISLTSGFLLFSARATSVIENSTFQTKMLLLFAAVVFHFLIQGRVTRQPQPEVSVIRGTAVVGLGLWMGLAFTACWFILFE